MTENIPGLSMGWFIPTLGDTSAFGDPSKAIHQSLDLFEKVAKSAETAGFDYALVPTNPMCWDAWITGSFVVARTQRLSVLLALKPGFIHPVAQAKMIAAFDQFSQGRIALNLIVGSSETDAHAEGQIKSKEDRYFQLEEEVRILKKLWTEDKVHHEGKLCPSYSMCCEPRGIAMKIEPAATGWGSNKVIVLFENLIFDTVIPIFGK